MQDLANALEGRLKELVDAAQPGFRCYAGQAPALPALEAPRIVISVQDGRELPQGSGNFLLSVQAEVNSSADDSTVPQHRARCLAALAPLMADDLADQINSGDGIGCQGVINRTTQHAVAERAYEDRLMFEVYCCLFEIA